jgi:signal transduction histidine kinase/CheY-like chemotaxis protein
VKSALEVEKTVVVEDAEQSAVDVAEHLEELRSETLEVLLLFLGALAYCWLVALVWLVTARRAPGGAWLSGACLLVGVCFTFYLRLHSVRLASLFLIAVVITSLAHSLFIFRLPGIAYLFVVPVALVGVLIGPRATGIVAAGCLLLLAAIQLFVLGWSLLSSSMLLPVLVIFLITVSSWLSQKNLYLSLAWALRACRRAQYKEKTLRMRTGELREALKALDEASYRLERTNYMLDRARSQAERARRVKQEFAQNISHELRTPLNLIIGFTKLMAQSPEYYGGSLAPAYLRDLSIVQRNAAHLGDLVNDVLDLARIEAAQMGLMLQEVDPAELVREAVGTARSLIESRGLSLRVEVGADLPQVWLDPTRIRQVLFNLLSNSARFTEEGGVTVRVEDLGDQLHFSVSDTGVGIPENELPKVFQEFHQIEDRLNEGEGGTGLGLAISKQFVELHGGRIWVESEFGKGSTFSFVIPVEGEGQQAFDKHEDAARAVDAEPKRKQRVLLAVTKSLSGMGLLSRHLRDVKTAIAPDLETAQEMAHQLLPQTVFVDTCSVETGDKELEEIGRRWNLPHVPFIACPLPSEEAWRQQLAVDGYLVKPVERDDLWDVLRHFGKGIDRILVVDDDQDFVRLLSRLLDNPVRRYEVHGAYTGEEALALARRWRPDLVLLDLALPGMQGARVAQRMRSAPDLRDIPIVVVSGKEGDSDGQTLAGALRVTRASGLSTSEVVSWVQQVVDKATGNGASIAQKPEEMASASVSEGT